MDQFEEIFSYRKLGSAEAGEADLFVQQLLRAGGEPGVPVYVMLTMRTDYLGHCALFRGLPEALNQGTYLVPRLTRHQQEEAITTPLAVSGVAVDTAVVDQLLNSAEANRDELPVLQHLLKRLWEEWAARGGSGTIDASESEKTGSWNDAIDRDAESVFGKLDAREQDAIKVVFQRITEKGTGERPIRTPCSLEELRRLTAQWTSAASLRELLEKFRARDLLVWADEERIDIPHECITWRWGRLARWIEDEDLDARRMAFIAESARSGTPLAGSALTEAIALRPRIAGPWTARYKLESADLTRWIDHSQREATRARQRTRNLVIGLALATLLFASLGVWALQQRKEADTNAKRAFTAKTEAETQAARAFLAEKAAKNDADRALAAEKMARAQAAVATAAEELAKQQAELATLQRGIAVSSAKEGRSRLGALLAEHSRSSIASDPELGLLLALEAGHATTREGEPVVPAADQALRRALAESGGVLLRAPEGEYIRSLRGESPVAISPDQRWVAASVEFSADPSRGVRLSRRKSEILDSEVLKGAEAPVAFTLDSRWLATGSTDGRGILLWNLSSGTPAERPRKLQTAGRVETLAVSPDGKWLVSALPAQIWDVSGIEPAEKPIAISAKDASRPEKPLPAASFASAQTVDGLFLHVRRRSGAGRQCQCGRSALQTSKLRTPPQRRESCPVIPDR